MKYIKKNGRIEANRLRFMADLTSYMEDEIYVITSRGISSIVIFQVVSEDDHDDINASINHIGSKIKKEIKMMSNTKVEYTCVGLKVENLFHECSSTLRNVIFLSPSPSVMIQM